MKSNNFSENRSPSLIPIIMQGLINGNPDGKKPEDIFVRTLIKKNRKMYRILLDNWKSMTNKEKRLKYPIYNKSSNIKSWIDKVENQTKILLEYEKKEKRNLQKLINREFHKTLSDGFASWHPTDYLKKRKTLSYIIKKSIYKRLEDSNPSCYCRCDCCSKESKADDNIKTPPSYGIILKKIKCTETDEIYHDEIFLMSVVTDNTGEPVLKTTNKFRMNDTDKKIVYPNEYLYPLKNPEGFLDFAATIWESDGKGYKKIANAAKVLAGSLASIPDVTVTKVASVTLGVIAGLLEIASFVDKDDKYGTISKTWSSETQLSEEIGEFTDDLIDYDTGLLDFTSYHYDFYLELKTI